MYQAIAGNGSYQDANRETSGGGFFAVVTLSPRESLRSCSKFTKFHVVHRTQRGYKRFVGTFHHPSENCKDSSPIYRILKEQDPLRRLSRRSRLSSPYETPPPFPNHGIRAPHVLDQKREPDALLLGSFEGSKNPV